MTTDPELPSKAPVVEDRAQHFPVQYFSERHFESDYEHDEVVTWQRYHSVRNSVMRLCRRYGTVGPMSERDISVNEETSEDTWQVECDDPAFFIVDDQYNDRFRYILVELASKDTRLLVETLMRELVEMLEAYSGWGVEFRLSDGCLIVYADRILVRGPRYANLREWTLESVLGAREATGTPTNHIDSTEESL